MCCADETLLLWGYETSNDWLLATKAKGKYFGNVQSIIKVRFA